MAFDRGQYDADQFDDDLPHARRVAEHLGIGLREVRATPDVVALWPKMVWHLDEPTADPAVINCFLIARHAREDGTKVLLSGQGADELFAGYRRHQGPELMRPASWVPRPLNRVISRGSLLLPGNRPGRMGGVFRRAKKLLAGAGLSADEQFVRYSQWTTAAERRALLAPEVSDRVMALDPEERTRGLLRRHPGASPLWGRLYRDLKTFLPALNLTYTDKSGMATGLECRVPYLDVELVEFASGLPDRMKLRGLTGKYLLRKALRNRLPPRVLTRPKTGFGAPLRKWLNHDLREFVDDLVSKETVERRGLFRWGEVERVRRDVRRGASDHTYLLWSLLTLELWHRAFLDAATPRPTKAAAPAEPAPAGLP
jgi:asparagine synthase (glutamine-hydrolysing)